MLLASWCQLRRFYMRPKVVAHTCSQMVNTIQRLPGIRLPGLFLPGCFVSSLPSFTACARTCLHSKHSCDAVIRRRKPAWRGYPWQASAFHPGVIIAVAVNIDKGEILHRGVSESLDYSAAVILNSNMDGHLYRADQNTRCMQTQYVCQCACLCFDAFCNSSIRQRNPTISSPVSLCTNGWVIKEDNHDGVYSHGRLTNESTLQSLLPPRPPNMTFIDW